MPMLDPQAMGLEPCSCGRIKIKMHCPHCGSYTCEVRARLLSVHRAFNSDVLKLTDKEVAALKREKMITEDDEILKVYKCRRCGSEFDESQWGVGFCNAPVYDSATARKQRRLHEKSQRNLTLTGVGADEEKLRDVSSMIFSGSPRERMLGLKKLTAKPKSNDFVDDVPLPSLGELPSNNTTEEKSMTSEEADAILREMNEGNK
jgi:hypothetical protein